MKIIDRYIIRSFLLNLVVWCFALCVIVFVVDFITHVGAFLEKDVEVNPIISIFSYYFFFCLKYLHNVVVYVAIFSALITLGTMIRQNELIALMALGTSARRILVPIIGTTIIVSIGMSWVRESFIPRHMIKIYGQREYFTKKTDSVSASHGKDKRTNISIQCDSVTFRGDCINAPVFTLPAVFGNNPITIKGKTAVYTPAHGDYPDGYVVHGVENAAILFERGPINASGKYFSETSSSKETTSEESAPAEENQEDILVYPPSEMPSLTPDSCFIVSGIPPQFLVVGDTWKNYASTADLISAYKNASLSFKSNDLLSNIHIRLIKPITDVFPLLIALPILFITRNTKSLCLRGIYSGLAASFFFAFTMMLKTLPKSFNPSLRAWLPIIVFLPIIVCLYKKLKFC